MQIIRNLIEDLRRDPIGTFINTALQIVIYGFGIYLVLTAGRCATNMVASAL